jgi:hypothetical protein
MVYAPSKLEIVPSMDWPVCVAYDGTLVFAEAIVGKTAKISEPTTTGSARKRFVSRLRISISMTNA